MDGLSYELIHVCNNLCMYAYRLLGKPVMEVQEKNFYKVSTYIHTYIHTYLPTYIPTYLPTYMHTYIHPQDGDVTPYQQKLKDLTLDTVWSKLKSSTGLEQKKKDVEVWMDGWIGGWMDSCRDTVWSKLKSSTNLEQKKSDVEVCMY